MSHTEPSPSVLRRDADFLHELAVLLEDLDPVVRPIADVHEPVVVGSAQCTGVRNCGMSAESGLYAP